MTDDGSFEAIRDDLDEHPIKLLFQYSTRYWLQFTLGVLSVLALRGMLFVPDLAIAAALDRVVTQSGEPGILTTVGLMPGDSVSGQAERLGLLYRLVAIATGAWIVVTIAQFSSWYYFQATAQRIQHDLRVDAYEHLQNLSMDFYHNHQTGGMMSILNSDINRLRNFWDSQLRYVVRAVAIVGAIAVIMAYEAPLLGLVVFMPIPIIVLATYKVMDWLEPQYRRVREHVARLNTRFSDNLSGMEVIKTFNRSDVEGSRVSEESEAYRDEQISVITRSKAFFASLRFLIAIVFVLVLLIGGRDIILTPESGITIGTFTLVFLFIRRLRAPMRQLGKTAHKYKKAKASAERVFALLAQEPRITSPEDPHVPEKIEGVVTFDDVEFSYERSNEKVLDGISLDVPPGHTVGLAGKTGSGKSTLLRLIPRLHDVTGGAVCVDGVDVREYDLHALRDEIAVVEQNPYLFSGTIMENVAYGDRNTFMNIAKAGGEISGEVESEIREATRAAGAQEFITELPNGYHTEVGEEGVKLSGGQRQRLAIARALLNDPAIIILDEATSDVDTETEEIIQENIETLIADRTAFIIAHRLSTIQDADRIVVVDDGEIAESGTHDELLSRVDSAYAALWDKQTNDGADSDMETITEA